MEKPTAKKEITGPLMDVRPFDAKIWGHRRCNYNDRYGIYNQDNEVVPCDEPVAMMNPWLYSCESHFLMESLHKEFLDTRPRGLRIAVWSPFPGLTEQVSVFTYRHTYGGLMLNFRDEGHFCADYRDSLPLSSVGACGSTKFEEGRLHPNEHRFAEHMTTLDQLLYLRVQEYHLLKLETKPPDKPRPIFGAPVEEWKERKYESLMEIHNLADDFWDSVIPVHDFIPRRGANPLRGAALQLAQDIAASWTV
jgi:hypothetical protein